MSSWLYIFPTSAKAAEFSKARLTPVASLIIPGFNYSQASAYFKSDCMHTLKQSKPLRWPGGGSA